MDQAIIDKIGRAPIWYDRAACIGLTEKFFPVYGKVFDERPAKAICAQCPVLLECFDHRMKTHEPGVWGHVDETEFHKFKGDYNQTVMARMTPEELRAYIVRVAAPRKPKEAGRPKRPGKKTTNESGLECGDGGGVSGGARDPLAEPGDAHRHGYLPGPGEPASAGDAGGEYSCAG